MISIIICSIDKTALRIVQENIAATIGVVHEIISIDNTISARGICAVYNDGTKQAKYDILCFMHEDIYLATQDWGKKILEIFLDKKVGLVGVAGSTYRSFTPSGWFPPSEFGTKPWRLNILQGSKYQERAEKREIYNPKQEHLSKVICVDGVWFCTTKKIALEIGFDERLLKGFHGYDIDFSMALYQKYEVLVSHDILLNHFSDGNFDSNWLKEIIKVQEKYSQYFPANLEDYSRGEIAALEKQALKRHIREILKNKDFTISALAKLLKYYLIARKISYFKYLKLMFKLFRR